jgi:hypothetical protein
MVEEGEEPTEAGPPPGVKANQFGSVWDSQIGMAGKPARLSPVTPSDEDDYAEPEIPEYLLAERRRSGGGGGGRSQGGRGGRGARSAYASAVDRERYGRSASSSRYPEPVRQSQPQSQPPRRRDERPQRQSQPPRQHGMERAPVRDSLEPWSEVPAELEELLRAQLSARRNRAEAGGGATTRAGGTAPAAEAEASAPKRRAPARKKAADTAEGASAAEAAEAPAKPSRSRRKPTAEETGAAPAAAAEAAPKRRAPARKKAAEAEPAAE